LQVVVKYIAYPKILLGSHFEGGSRPRMLSKYTDTNLVSILLRSRGQHHGERTTESSDAKKGIGKVADYHPADLRMCNTVPS
jgi:hypothetical protein